MGNTLINWFIIWLSSNLIVEINYSNLDLEKQYLTKTETQVCLVWSESSFKILLMTYTMKWHNFQEEKLNILGYISFCFLKWSNSPKLVTFYFSKKSIKRVIVILHYPVIWQHRYGKCKLFSSLLFGNISWNIMLWHTTNCHVFKIMSLFQHHISCKWTIIIDSKSEPNIKLKYFNQSRTQETLAILTFICLSLSTLLGPNHPVSILSQFTLNSGVLLHSYSINLLEIF